MRRRALIYAALALTVPLPALAVGGRGGPADLPELSVAASLDTCGTAADTIVCKIDASWNQIPGATRYTASVTRADGSVVDFGDVGAGAANFWVPYVGNGTYTVSVSAYGTAPGSAKPEVIAKGTSAAPSSQATATGGPAEAPGPDATGGAVTDEEPSEPGSEPGTEPEEPTCEVPEEPDPTVPEPVEEPAGEPGTDSAPISDAASAKLDESAVLPESVECPPEVPAPGPATG